MAQNEIPETINAPDWGNSPIRNESLEVQKFAKAPDWDEPFKPTNQWGKLASNITELSNQIEQAAKQLRQNLPKSDRNFVAIKQSSGILDITIRGGVRYHSDLDMWVTTKTMRPVMLVMCSARNLKPQIEGLLSSQQTRNLYHDLANALRYVIEPPKSETVKNCVTTSGHSVLPGYKVTAIQDKNVFRCFGYVFVGDEPRARHKNYIAEILDTLKIGEIFYGLTWDEPLTQEKVKYIEDTFGPLANNLIELAKLVCESRVKYMKAGQVKREDARWIEVGENSRLACSVEKWGILIRTFASAKLLRSVIESAAGSEQQARKFYEAIYTAITGQDLGFGKMMLGAVLSSESRGENQNQAVTNFQADLFSETLSNAKECNVETITKTLETWHSNALLIHADGQRKDTETNTSPLAALKNPVTCAEVGGKIRKRSDNIATALINHNYTVVKAGRKNYCNAEDAAVLWPKWKKHWQGQQTE